MKGKITYSLKPSLTKRPSEVGYWELNEMPGSAECLIQKHQFLNFCGKKVWGNHGKRVKPKWKRRVSNWWNQIRKRGFLSMVESHELWTLRPTIWTSQIWNLVNNFVIVLVCAKCSKLITLEEIMISIQQLPLCLPLFFAFSSEVLNSGIKSCFDGVVFQDTACEECFSICLQCLHLKFLFKFIFTFHFYQLSPQSL